MRIVPAKHGAKWLADGLALFRKNPALWLFLVLTYWLAVALLGQIPYAGPALSMLVLPAFTMSFMTACAILEAGGRLRPSVLLAGFGPGLRKLLGLGVLYLLSVAAVLAISSFADAGGLAEGMLLGREGGAEPRALGPTSRALLLSALAGTPVFLAFWFAPPLVAWAGLGPVQSLFYSFFAAWRNWRAFLVYGAVLMLAGMAFLAALTVIVAVTGGHAQAARMMVLLFTVFSLPILFGSFYASYRDVFPEHATDAGA